MARRPLWVLGINAYDHDVAACLLRDGEIAAAVARERITRVKHDSGFFREPVEYVLAAAGIPLERVDLVVRNSYLLPVPDLERILLQSHRPDQLSARERKEARASPLFLAESDRVETCSHHLAHAYSAFAVSPFAEGAVMVVDGVGSHRADVTETVPPADDAHPLAREAESWYRFSGTKLTTVRKVFMGPVKGGLADEFWMLPGLGARYSRVSTYIFGHWNRCGEVMGLAAWGRPGAPPQVVTRDGEITFPDWPLELDRPFLGGGDRAWERSPHRAHREDLARRMQEDLEEALVARARRLYEITRTPNLCLAGGVALNCLANRRILEETPFENLFVTPAAGDDGVALGCACYGHLARGGGKRPPPLESAALGRAYGTREIRAALEKASVRLAARTRRVRDPARAAAGLLARGRIVGWFQGRSEFGPRALGHRSILADPRRPEMKDRVNARVKRRQGFRPFAPAVPLEHAKEYFEGPGESPFMVLAKRVRPAARDRIPAVVHVDGTARVQTVRREAEPLFHALLTAFGERTGIPVLLNTSFNVRGDPIVETPADAVECFLETGLDALVLGDLVVEKRPLGRGLASLFRGLAAFRRTLGSPVLLERTARALLEEE